MTNVFRRAGALSLVVLAACDGGTDEGGLVARAGSHAFTVDDAVDLLAAEPGIPSDAEIVGQLAELWMDYTLIALAAQEDSTLSTVGLGPIVDLQIRQTVVNRFVDENAPADTAVTDEELRAIWDEERPRGEVRARHILVTYPIDATSAIRDTVRAGLERIREQIVSGAETFEAMAERYSRDGSATGGGDLGWFGPGDMVGPFDAAVYALEVGEVSDVVETPFGLHLIRLDDRRDPDFEATKEQYRRYVLALRVQEADSAFFEQTDPGIELREGSAEVAAEIARQPRAALTGRARRRVLAEFDGGTFEAGEFWDFLQTISASDARQLGGSNAEAVGQFVENLATTKALSLLADEAGIRVPPAERDSIVDVARQSLVTAADMMGLRLVTPEPGETNGQAVDRVVRTVVREVVSRQRQAVPLSAATVELRERLGGAVMTTGVRAATDRLSELRGPAAAPTPAPAPIADTTAAVPDTTSGN